jgi:1-acyl-sn-glycerol-3-phosphate acyltransferase
MDKFSDIRPYQDGEVRAVLDSLLTDREMLNSIARFYAPRLSRLMPPLTRWLARRKLTQQLEGVDSIKEMQHVIATYMDKMIEDTTTSLTHSGMENLALGRSYLFVSNHRDIAMDPAFVNYMLYHAGFETLQIAIGDNLLKKPFVSDLMRLNKSFIVRRSVKGRELLAASKLLSEYIHHCIETDNNVWIAQREGRAKDGIDRTDPALLKMLAIAHRKEPFGESLSRLHIVPVTLSYEYDACDELKARELAALASGAGYAKDDQTDIRSIVTGMMGEKGAVHVAFGAELVIDSDEPEAVAAQIDAQIIANYQLRDINYLALAQLLSRGLLTEPEKIQAERVLDRWSSQPNAAEAFSLRLMNVADDVQEYWLRSYANGVLMASELIESEPLSPA